MIRERTTAHPSGLRSRLLVGLALTGLIVATAACTSSGGLGPVPTPPITPVPSVGPSAPDLTPEPSAVPTPSPTPSVPAGTPEPRTPSPTDAPAKTMVVRAYFVLEGEVGVEGLVPTLRDVPQSVAVARAAMEVLLAGEILDDYDVLSTAVPAGTRLLGLSVKDGIATVDLSREFESGGGSASTFYRLGQVVYTLTQFDTIDAVTFQIEGRTVTTFGSEGVILDGPQARADFEDQLPAVFVDRPAFAAAATGGVMRVGGNANVFEAVFMITILDRSGAVIAEENTMATCGTGCRGTFSEDVEYTVGTSQWGTLRVWVSSAKDGLPENVRDYPIWLQPAG
jgi:germination protein M